MTSTLRPENYCTQVQWCTLLMSTVGLFKMNNRLESAYSCEPTAFEQEACSGSMGGLLKVIAIWFLVDLQSRLFRHHLFKQVSSVGKW